MRKFFAQALSGRFHMGDDAERFKKFLLANEGMRMEVKPLMPESRSQRKFLHGAVYPLWAYCDGKDYKDETVLADMHEIAKIEFNGALVNANGKVYKVGRTSVGELREGFIDKIIDYLEEHYGIDRTKVLLPEDYKHWRDAIFPYSGPKYYIDYLVKSGTLYDRNSDIR